MSKKLKRPEEAALQELHERLEYLRSLMPALSPRSAKKAMNELVAFITAVESARTDLDGIREPGGSFDPANPDTAGRLVALALMAQDRIPLAQLVPTYGSGVYAIYYRGDHPSYAVLSGTETPIYVGKADPAQTQARTPREQGTKLYDRLADHCRMIRTVSEYALKKGLPHPLRLDDFQCRRLVCATNAQLVAENHLIQTFHPIWNSEVGICWGISKHGDAAKTRKNKRSPWDVMHPGRGWAMDEELEDKMSSKLIQSRINEHFTSKRPYKSKVQIINKFMAAFAQTAAMVRTEQSPYYISELTDDQSVSD